MDVLTNMVFGGKKPLTDGQTPTDPQSVQENLTLDEKKFVNEMPEFIDFKDLGDFDKTERDFMNGLESLETQFALLIQKTENEFDEKQAKLKLCYRKLFINYKFIKKVHEKNQESIQDQIDRINLEKSMWEKEKLRMRDFNQSHMGDVLTLNVGGN